MCLDGQYVAELLDPVHDVRLCQVGQPRHGEVLVLDVLPDGGSRHRRRGLFVPGPGGGGHGGHHHGLSYRGQPHRLPWGRLRSVFHTNILQSKYFQLQIGCFDVLELI